MNEYNKRMVLQMKNIIKDENGNLQLQNSYYEDGDKIKHVNQNTKDNHECLLCSRYNLINSFYGEGECKIFNSLYGSNVDSGKLVCNCCMFDEVKKLNIIKSQKEMVDFMKRTVNFFQSLEDFEEYYGICKRDKYGETINEEEYYNRCEEFTKIPTKYPCVIRFDLQCEQDLEWIYIGE